jgi:hypothetical protein
LEGKENQGDKYPSAWTYDPFNATGPPFVPKVGQIIAVWDYHGDCVKHKKFCKIKKGSGAYVDSQGLDWSNARPLTELEQGK